MQKKNFYELIEEDVQEVAKEEIGRNLTSDELAAIKDDVAENINWYEAIANVINKKIELSL